MLEWVPFPSPGDLPIQGLKLSPVSLALVVDSFPLVPSGKLMPNEHRLTQFLSIW